MPSKKPAANAAVEAPFLGLHLDRPAHLVPPTGFSACNNVRIYKNRLTSSLMGWTKRLGPLNGPICGGGLFTISNTNFYQYLIIGTKTDIYSFSTSAPQSGFGLQPAGLFFITPAYVTGTASASGTAVTGSGTLWNTLPGAAIFRRNVRPGDQISFGSATQNLPGATWYTVQTVNSDTSLTLTSSAGTVASGPYTIRQCFAADTGFYRWAFESFPQAGAPDNNDVILMANSGGENASAFDPIFKWRPTDTFGTIQTGFSFTCGRLRRFQNMMIYGRLLTANGYQATSIANSDNGLPVAVSSGIAGQYVVSDGPWQIQFLGALGNSLLIYTGGQAGGQIISASFVGAPTFFNFSTVIRGRGPLASGFVVEFPDRHQFVGSDGEYRYNGLFIQPMNDHVWRQLITQLDYTVTSAPAAAVNTRLDQAICVPAPTVGDVIWALPLITDSGATLQTGYTEHYMEQANNYLFKPYTQRDTTAWTAWLGTPASSVFGVANMVGPLVGDNAGNIHSLYDADLQNLVGYASTATFGARIVAGERSRGLIKRIYPFAEVGGNFNLQVALAMQDRVGGPVTLTDTQTFNLLAPTNRFTTHYRRGRVGAVTFSTAGPSQPWTLDGYDWDLPEGSPGGKR